MAPDFPAKVILEASVSPSEDPAKVVAAMANLLPKEGSVDIGRRMVRIVSGGADSLDGLHNQFRDRHVRGAARRLLLYGTKGRSTTLLLNRQAAAAGVVALCSSPDQSPLGPIEMTIESKRLDSLIEWLTAYESG